MHFWRNLLERLGDAGVWAFIVALFVLSAYFTWDVQMRRGAWRSDEEATTLGSGAQVRLLQVIDGDEISVADDAGARIVRILGIKAFDPHIQDPGVSGTGLAAVERLTQILQQDETLTLVYDTLQFDKAGRMLAYMELNGSDVGAQLISDGLALADTRHPFSRQTPYEQLQSAARRNRRGLWLHPKATQRAEALIQSWQTER